MKALARASGLIAVALLVCGCASTEKVQYTVESEPSGAPVVVNGASMGETPAEFWIDVPKRWVGLMNAPGGWAYQPTPVTVRIMPPSDYAGDQELTSQTRQLRADQSVESGEARIRANLFLEPRMPTQPIEVR